MIDPNFDEPKFKNKNTYLVRWWQDDSWHQIHYDTLELACGRIKALEYANLVWSLIPVKI